MIPGGYVLQPRCIRDSWVAHAPPVVRETWAFLLRKAKYRDEKYLGFIVKRGQLFITFQEIRDALSWKVGARLERYSENQMKHAMKLLRSNSMVDLTKHPRGNLITICNYDLYQNPDNYESTSESTSESSTNHPRINQPFLSINKEVKEVKEEDKGRRTIPPRLSMVEDYCAERANGIDAQSFVDFYESKGWVVGKERMKDWQAAIRTWEGKRKDEKKNSNKPDQLTLDTGYF